MAAPVQGATWMAVPLSCMYRHENYGYDMGCYSAGGSTGVMPIHNDHLTSFRLV
ncbi:hypothetical protein [Streptomyces sp. NPDC002913]